MELVDIRLCNEFIMAALCNGRHYIFALWFLSSLWPPCVADADIIFLSCDFYLLFYSSPNLSGRRLDVYNTSTQCGLSANWESGLKCAARGSLKMQDPKNRQKVAMWAHIAQLCRATSSQLRHVSTIAIKLVKQQYLPHVPQYGEQLRSVR